MLRRTILRLAHPVSLQELLDSLVTCTGSRSGPHRTQVPALEPVAAGASKLPVWIPPDCREAGIVYSTAPCCARPTGEPILWIQLRPVPRRGRECDGKYRGDVYAAVWQDKRYPLEKREVNWCIADFCGCRRHSWWTLSRGWQTLHDASLQDSPAAGDRGTGPRPRLVLSKEPPEGRNTPAGELGGDAAGGTPEKQAPSNTAPSKRRGGHRGSGEARKPHTIWLMEQMRPLENLYDCEHLYEGYVHKFEESEGKLPSNPRASFDDAVASCRERILREGKRR